MAETSAYVSNDTWVRTTGRPDAIDDIADQFERRSQPAPPVKVRDGEARWPLRSRGWRSIARLHPQTLRRTA